MATRDPNIISEIQVKTSAGTAVVHELAGDKGPEYKVKNPEALPVAFLSSVLDQARQMEEKGG